MSINDCKYSAIASVGALNDKLLAYYKDNGATSDDINDAVYEFLLANGASSANINDMWREFLAGKGYTGSLNDMLYQFWCADGGAIGYLLKLNGTNYMTLSEPKTFVGDFEFEVKFNTTIGTDQVLMGDDHNTTYYFNIVPDINTVSMWFAGTNVGFTTLTAMGDGKAHTVKYRAIGTTLECFVDGVSLGVDAGFVPYTGLNNFLVGTSNSNSVKFLGTIYTAKLTDLATPANSIEWNIDSGPAKYTTGNTESVTNGDFSDGVNDWNAIASTILEVDGTLQVTSTGVNGRASQSGPLQAGEAYVFAGEFSNVTGLDGKAVLFTTPSYTKPAELLSSGSAAFVMPSNGDTNYEIWLVAGSTAGYEVHFDNISVKPYIATLSDGTIYQDSETYGTLPDIMRADEWVLNEDPTNITTTGKTVTMTGSQGALNLVYANNNDTYIGLHILTVKVTNYVAGTVRVWIGVEAPAFNLAANGVFTSYQNPASLAAISVQDNGDAFDGSVEIISIKPVPEGLLMQNITNSDWVQA